MLVKLFSERCAGAFLGHNTLRFDGGSHTKPPIHEVEQMGKESGASSHCYNMRTRFVVANDLIRSTYHGIPAH
jgi:hypothetical protein